MKPLKLSSGDLLADRRADYAEMLFSTGDVAAAFEPLRDALELAPDWAMGWYRLGEMLEAAGMPEQAAEAWRRTLALEPDDRPGAALKLELIGQAPPSSAPPGGYVEALFDSYARTFETSLVQKLVYRVPELVLAAIEARGVRRFRRAIDLGCGTGLMGAALRPFVDRLEGCDISSSMLRKAEAKAIYDRLEKADLQTLSIEPMSVDLVVAADGFLYVGALERIMATVAAGLAPDGLFAFSVEKHEGPRDMALRPSRRYAHSQAYLRRVVAAAGMEVASMQTAVIRMDRGEPIEGLIVVAAFPSP
jgi:predicted TPR repeat methyltransferase